MTTEANAGAIIIEAPKVPAQAPAATPAAAPAADAAKPDAAAPAAAPAADTPPASFETPAPTPAPQTPAAEVVVYEKTGDKGLDVALRYVGQLGFKPDTPAMQAAAKGDFAPLEAALKALGDKADGYEDYLALAKDSYTRRTDAAKAAQAATNKLVYDAVGGEANWKAVHAWAAAHADEKERAELNASFKVGGVAAEAAAGHLKALYDKHGKTAPKSVVKDEATGAPANSSALSPREYQAEVNKLYASLGSRMDKSPEYKALQERRRAYRA